ncbi:MAG: hypothetical protein K0Q73_8131, partial [Paenibacillus sp.]|nr:hypothetical protein [Paenibacillus sp.]
MKLKLLYKYLPLVIALILLGTLPGNPFVSATGTPDPAFYNVKDYGATGNGYTDDTVAIRSAISAAANGGVVFFPDGSYVLKNQSSTETELLLLTNSVRLLGTGFQSRLVVDNNVPNTVDVVKIRPPATNEGYLYSIEAIIFSVQPGDFPLKSIRVKPARHGIYLDTPTASQKISQLLIRHNSITEYGGEAIYLNSPAGVNGLSNAAIENNAFNGSVNLINAGSNIQITGNTLTGLKKGIVLKHGTGASHAVISYNNITAKMGAIKVTGGDQIKILYNQMEQNQVNKEPLAEDRVMIDLEGQSGSPIQNTEIIGNNVNGHQGNSDLENNIRLEYATNTKIYDNVIGQGVGDVIHIASSSEGTDIGTNTIFGPAPNIVDLGVGTIGLKKSATLLNSWVNYDSLGWEGASYIKEGNGIVHLGGMIKNGTAAAGTVLFQLPEPYRPLKARKFRVASSAAGVSEIEVQPDGDVVLNSGTNTYVSLNGISYTVR